MNDEKLLDKLKELAPMDEGGVVQNQPESQLAVRDLLIVILRENGFVLSAEYLDKAFSTMWSE